MGLHQLAAELRLAIAELLDPRTCFKLALASRDDHRLYSSMLAKYKTLFARYNTIDTADAGRLVWDITREVIEDPSLAYVIEDISLPDSRQTVWEANTNLDMFRHQCRALLPEDAVKLYAEAVRKIPVIDEAMQGCPYDPWFYGPNWDMEQSIRIGTDEPIIALLVAMATNLRTLRFTQYNERNEWPSAIRNIAREYLYATPPPSTLPLQHLKYVAISYADTEMCCSAEWAEIFPTLPSLVGFAARKMGGTLDPWRDERGEDEPDDYVGKSNVKDMIFDWSFFNPEALVQIISGPAALRSFIYTNGGACVSDEGCFASRKITAALVKYHAESLEELSFGGEDNEDFGGDYDLPSASFRGFKKLRTLRCDWSTIAGDDDDDELNDQELHVGFHHTNETSSDDENSSSSLPQTLANRLPASLEALHIDIPSQGSCLEEAIAMVQASRTSLPNLKQLHFSHAMSFTHPLRQTVEEKKDFLETLRERGIAYDDKGRYAYRSESFKVLSKLLEGQGDN